MTGTGMAMEADRPARLAPTRFRVACSVIRATVVPQVLVSGCIVENSKERGDPLYGGIVDGFWGRSHAVRRMLNAKNPHLNDAIAFQGAHPRWKTHAFTRSLVWPVPKGDKARRYRFSLPRFSCQGSHPDYWIVRDCLRFCR